MLGIGQEPELDAVALGDPGNGQIGRGADQRAVAAEAGAERQGPPQRLQVFGAESRLRPILMTSCAMIAGMLPMAIGLGEGGSQTAPLGRAVIGGLTGGTIATLIILPAIFAILQGERTRKSASLLPADLAHAMKLEQDA